MIINLKSQTELSGFYIIYDGSTNLETPGYFGMSHWGEHLKCKSFDHLLDDFQTDGISWNAYTSSNEVVFHFLGLDEKINKWKYVIYDLMKNFELTEKQFENERSIIIQEYEDCFNDQSSTHQLNLSRKIFNDYDPIGLKSDIENISFKDFKNFFDLQYSNPSKIINVSIANDFINDSIEFANIPITRKISYGDNNNQFELNNQFEDKTSIAIISPIMEEDFGYINFINSMIGSGLNSPLYKEVREKRGLVYFIRCSLSRVNKQGITVISTLTSNENFDAVVESVKYVIDNPDIFLTQSRFDVIRESLLVNKKKSEINRYSSVDKWIDPKGWYASEVLDIITLEKVREVYDKYYQFERFYISNDKTEFLK